jgi:hypothetical protein
MHWLLFIEYWLLLFVKTSVFQYQSEIVDSQ